ncbi:MAG: hypothetical protein P4L84_19095 [Isosphaeraceae bacterium]|nr:hypothetical protein [Isosphaeraceae bacterium]
MVRKSAVGIVLSVVLACPPTLAGGPWAEGPPTSTHFLHRLGPAGGWNPDGGGLFHWWNPDCFPAPCTPDDYCRKPIPRPYCPPRPVRVGHVHGHPGAHGCPACARAH